MPWASGPRGGQRGRLVVENMRTLVQSAAEHCALMRIYDEKDAWKGNVTGYGVEYVIVCEWPRVEWFTNPRNGEVWIISWILKSSFMRFKTSEDL